MFRAVLYARVSTNDQQTLAMQNRAIRECAARRRSAIDLRVREVGCGAEQRRQTNERRLDTARLRKIDVGAPGSLGPIDRLIR